MAHRDPSRTFSELDTDDLVLESTGPTEESSLSALSLSISSGDKTNKQGKGDGGRHRAGKVTQQLIERKQLLHDVQLLKIELNQKKMELESTTTEYVQKIEELEEKLSDCFHHKQLLQTKLESQLKIQQDEARRRQEYFKKEVEMVLKRQHQLEETNSKLLEKAGDIRRSLAGDLTLSEEQYLTYRSTSEEALSIREFVMVKLYEALAPLKSLNRDLTTQRRNLETESERLSEELRKSGEVLDNEHQAHQELQLRHQKLTIMLADTKCQVQHDNFKIENYDSVKLERDALGKELEELEKKHGFLESIHQTVTREREAAYQELTTAKQSISLLQQDKEYLDRQVTELQHKVIIGEEKTEALGLQLEEVKRAREELYEKYVGSRDLYKSEYETRLKEELDQIRLKTNTEVDRLRHSTHEMFEVENRNLRETRDNAVVEKDRAVLAEKEMRGKYENILAEFRQLQVMGDNRVSELQNDLKIRTFENERTQMIYEETVKNLKESQLENEKTQKKLEVLTKEYYTLQNTNDAKLTSLEAEVKEKSSKLMTYEKLEEELDDVVMQAAEIENEEEAERVLFSYGYGANVPSTAKRRLKQSVHLARRVLHLERANVSLRNEVEREKSRIMEISEELDNANSMLSQTQQPYNYLVDSLRSRDTTIKQQKEKLSSQQEDIRRLEKERTELVKTKNEMTADLERLLSHREELAVMKQVALNMSSCSGRPSPTGATASDGGYHGTKPWHVKSASKALQKDFPDDSFKPQPVLFTNPNGPVWHRKLKTKQGSESDFAKAYDMVNQ